MIYQTRFLTLLALMIPLPVSGSPITGWEIIFDGDIDTSFSSGTGATSSPEINDAHKSSIAANFPSVTLADGESLVLSGTVSFSDALANGQFRFGLFDGDNPVTAGDGTGYVGTYAEAPASGGSAYITSNDGTNTDHPFSTPGTIADLATMSDPGVTPTTNTPLDFSLTLTRQGTNVDFIAIITDGDSYYSSAGVLGTAPVPGSFTYNSAAFLMGGSNTWDPDNLVATYSNIDVTHVVSDETDPTLLTTNPASGASGVGVITELTANFNEGMAAGIGNITIRNLTKGTDMTFSAGAPQVTVSGGSVIINPASSLDWGDLYAIQIEDGALTDLAGNPFGGILPPDVSTWSFTTDANPKPTSKDFIVGEREAGGLGLDYYPDGAENMVGTGGTTGKREDRNVVLGFPLPTLPAGTTVDTVDFSFEIAAARAASGTLPNLQVYLLDATDPDGTGTALFFHGSDDPSPDVELVGTTSVSITGTAEVSFPDDTEDRVLALTGDALALFQSFYGGDHIPDRPEVFFRFNLDEDPALTSYRRYRIDLADDESGIEVVPTSSGDTFAGWIDGFGLAPGDQGFDFDADGDGLENGVESWFGTDPSLGSAGLTQVARSGNELTFEHPVADPVLTDVEGSYEWSVDLATWHAPGATAGGTTVDILSTTTAGTTTVTATLTTGNPTKLFVRAVAILN